METIEYQFIDKSKWPSGVWSSEPDKIQWQDDTTGLPCLILRVKHSGHLCGYVGVPPGHPWFEMAYEDVPVEIHWGLTFANFCQHGEEHGVCHVTAPEEPDRVWWLGFDCGHCEDLSPAYSKEMYEMFLREWNEYRDVEYVRGQCRSLAKQIKEAAI